MLELPAAPPQPWCDREPGNAAGQVEVHRLQSDILRNERRVWIYTPPGYSLGGEPYDLLLLFDGLAYIDPIPTPTILDNLLAAGRIRPMVAVILDTLDQKTRTLELNCYRPFIDFLANECLPWLRKQVHITSDPRRTIVGGSSSGGLAAAYAALCFPDLFGNVLSQSGFYAWAPDIFEPADESEHEWLARQFTLQQTKPIRLYMDVGLLETGQHFKNDPPSPRVSNRHMRIVLQAKGYDVHYVEFCGGHDYLCWRGTLADGLLALVDAR
jgi:enterochelin esterase family protein